MAVPDISMNTLRMSDEREHHPILEEFVIQPIIIFKAYMLANNGSNNGRAD